MRACALVCLLLLSATVRAEERPEGEVREVACPALRAVSLYPLALGTSSLAAQYEQFVIPGLYSVVGGVGTRLANEGDFRLFAFSLGVEGRRWFAPNACQKGRAPQGLFLSTRLDIATQNLRDAVARERVGSSLIFAETMSIGWRFVLWQKAELSPLVHVGLRAEVDPGGRLPPFVSRTLGVGLTAGWVF